MKTVVIIPARYGSSRFPGKPLADIAGTSMIVRVCQQASKATNVDMVVVATDDERIEQEVNQHGFRAVMTQSDAPSGTDRIDEAAQKLGLADDDIIINLQGDQPLVDPDCISELATLFKESPGQFQMATLCYPIKDVEGLSDPNQVKVVFDNQHYALYFSRSTLPYGRDIPSDSYPVYRHLGIYGYTRRFVQIFRALPEGRLEQLEKLEQLRALENGYKIKLALAPSGSPEVDAPEDVARCLAYMQSQSCK